MIDSVTSAPYQPNVERKYCVAGSIANWPNEPAAAEMPSAMLRFSGGNVRPMMPAKIENVRPDRLVPISTPAVSTSVSGVVAWAIVTRPSAYRSAPASTTFAVPNLSASTPANGWVMPHIRFCTAIASANVSRPQPRSEDIGCRNSPKP